MAGNDSFSILHSMLMKRVYRIFSSQEARLILDALNGHFWRDTPPVLHDSGKEYRNPSWYRGSLYLSLSDHIDLNQADVTYQIQKQPLLQKVQRLSGTQAVCVLAWAEKMWERGQDEKFWEVELGRFSGT